MNGLEAKSQTPELIQALINKEVDEIPDQVQTKQIPPSFTRSKNMAKSHILALIVAYYLSKFNEKAYQNLGFSTQRKAHQEIGRLLGVNPNSIKNMRDEFDPINDNPRVGWYQRPLRPSRVKVVEVFQNLSEEELRDIVLEILTKPDSGKKDDFENIINSISIRVKRKKGNPVFIIRGPTGRKAEEYFIENQRAMNEPVPGSLIDRRDHGCGYDFEIHSGKGDYQIEVKGLDAEAGGIVFTSKEWDTARIKGNTYFLVIVRNVSSDPKMQIIQNPARSLDPKKNIFTTVQVRWTLSDADLTKVPK